MSRIHRASVGRSRTGRAHPSCSAERRATPSSRRGTGRSAADPRRGCAGKNPSPAVIKRFV